MAFIDRFRRRDTRSASGTRNFGDTGNLGDARDLSNTGVVSDIRDISDCAAAAGFIDEQSCRLAEVSVHGYCRLLAGANADTLFATAPFVATLNKTCWEAYPRILAMVATVSEAVLRPCVSFNPDLVRAGLVTMVLENFDRRPVPQSVGGDEWRAARADLERSLLSLAIQRLRTVETVVQEEAGFYLTIMPLHPKLGPDDFPALCNQLRQSLQQIRDEVSRRFDLPALVSKLAARTPTIQTIDAPSITA